MDRISAEAQRIAARAVARKAGRLLLAAIGWFLFGVGWTVRKTLVVLWLAAAWSWTAIRLGWRDAGPKAQR
jgi:hypothetical protein